MASFEVVITSSNSATDEIESGKSVPQHSHTSETSKVYSFNSRKSVKNDAPYHVRTASCESTFSTASSYSSNSSGSSSSSSIDGVLLHVNSLNRSVGNSITKNNIHREGEDSNNDSSVSSLCKTSDITCDIDTKDNSARNLKSRKFFNFSVIRKSCTNSKQFEYPMGSDTLEDSSRVTTVTNMGAYNSSEEMKVKAGDPDDADGDCAGNRPEPEGHDEVLDCLQKSQVAGIPKSKAFLNLEAELASAQKELKLKEEEVCRLSRIRDEVESELQELTASLFQEAHRMVEEANLKRASAEKCLQEALMKIDGLETEVAALKTLVLTSTPSQPNRHLHPQIDPKNQQVSSRSCGNNSNNNNKKSPIGSSSSLVSLNTSSIIVGAGGLTGSESNCNISCALNDLQDCSSDCCLSPDQHRSDRVTGNLSERHCIDPILRQEYIEWKKSPSLERSKSKFLERIYREDIDMCLDFDCCGDVSFKERIVNSIQNQTICIVPLKPENIDSKKSCSLLNTPHLLCKYRVRLGGGNNNNSPVNDCVESYEEFDISQLARNRITAVCDSLNYLDYIVKGLVKSHVNNVYWEILQLRKRMFLARLGFSQD